MPDTPTKVADILQPEVFNPYVIQETTRVNEFFRSGIVGTVEGVSVPSEGGTIVNMPFWKPLGERAQLLDDTKDLEIKKIGTGQDKAVLHARALVYGSTDMAAALAGDDPMRVIGQGLAENWSYEMNQMLLSMLDGVMDAVGEGNTLDLGDLSGDAGILDGTSFIDAAQMLGDHKDRLAGIAMHSAIEARLAKNDLIETVRDSEGNIVMRSFMGKRVIVDDSMGSTSGKYSSFLFGPAAIGYAEGSPKVPSEAARNPLINSGQEYIVSRRHFVLHPRGVAWNPQSGVPNLQVPSDAELADSGNWNQVYDTKLLRIVRIISRIE